MVAFEIAVLAGLSSSRNCNITTARIVKESPLRDCQTNHGELYVDLMSGDAAKYINGTSGDTTLYACRYRRRRFGRVT